MTSNDFRETTVRVVGVERVIRTERVGKVKTVKQLEAAHTKCVKATIVEMRRANLAVLEAAALKAEENKRKNPGSSWAHADAQAARRIARRAERGTLPSYGTYDVAAMKKPFPAVRFTDAVPEYLVEVEPGHYATAEVAEELTLC
ncbi:hypothetical protein [Streptomyces sp. NPDC060001]|uniref:hypothetical protein n=1 Tax=Streptomyces sp. NPDC060001 TaxID=3347032 RepID=UPI00368F714A